MAETLEIAFAVNGRPVTLRVSPSRRLLDVLREDLRLTGAKEGCGKGECGACTVLVDGRPVDSCLMLAYQADGSAVETIEGLAEGDRLHPLQEAFVETGGSQCGICIPGMIMAAKGALDRSPQLGHDQIRHALAGNLCRCTGYTKIFEAVALARGRTAPKSSAPPPAGRAPARQRPRSLREALEILAQAPGTRPIAGGTDILVKARDGQVDCGALFDLSLVPELEGIEERGDELWIGAAVTHSELVESPLVARLVPALAQACSVIGGPQIRNRGTLGGNLANASPAADTVPPLFAADAVVELGSLRRTRRLPITEVFTGPGVSVLEPDELILGVVVPIRPDVRGAFIRLGQRQAQAISKVSVAVALGGESRQPDWVRVAFGAVAPTVIRARGAEELLVKGGPESIEAAAEAARHEVRPIDDLRSTGEYRREMAAVILRRAVERVRASGPAASAQR